MASGRWRAVIFDVDGTLVDSNDAHAQSWLDVLKDFPGVTYPRVRALIGKGGDKLLPELTGIETESPEGKQLSAQRKELFRERYLPNLVPFLRARALLQRLHDEGIRTVVASSAEREELKVLLEIAGVTELIEEMKSSSDAERSKPDPDIVDAALQHLGLPHSQVLMIGDTPYDIEAANRAGIEALAFRCGGHWTDEDLRGAIAIYDGPEDLLSHYERSLLA